MKKFIFLSFVILYSRSCFSMTEADRANLVTQPQLTETKQQFEKDIAKINGDIATLNSKNEFTLSDKAQLKTLAKELENLEKQLNTFEQKFNKALKEKVTLEDFNVLSSDFNKLKNQFEQLNNKPTEMSASQLSDLQSEVTNFRKDYNNFKKDQKNELDDMKSAIVKHDDVVKELLVIIKGKRGFKGLEDQVFDIQRSINSLNNDLQQNKTDSSDAFKRIKKIEDAMKSLSEELKKCALREDLASTSDNVNLLSKFLEQEKNKLINKQQFDALHYANEDLFEKNNDLENRLERLENIIHGGAIAIPAAIITGYFLYKAFYYLKNKWQKKTSIKNVKKINYC